MNYQTAYRSTISANAISITFAIVPYYCTDWIIHSPVYQQKNLRRDSLSTLRRICQMLPGFIRATLYSRMGKDVNPKSFFCHKLRAHVAEPMPPSVKAARSSIAARDLSTILTSRRELYHVRKFQPSSFSHNACRIIKETGLCRFFHKGVAKINSAALKIPFR